MKRFAATLFLCALSLCAADVSGNWSGKLDTGKKGGPFWLTLKQTRQTLTGAGGFTEQEQQPIRNAKLDGEKITFEVPLTTRNGLTSVCHFTLTVKGDAIEGDGEVPGEHGDQMAVKVSLKRVTAR